MTTSATSPPPRQPDTPAPPDQHRWEKIETLLDRLESLAGTVVGVGQFYEELLVGLVGAVDVTSVLIWGLSGDEIDLKKQAAHSLSDEELSQLQSVSRQCIAHSLKEGGAYFGPRSKDAEGVENPTSHAIYLHNIQVDSQQAVVLEFVFSAGTNSRELRWGQKVAGAVGEVLADCLRRARLKELLRQQNLLAESAEFSAEVHQSLKLKEVALTIAHAGKRLIGECRVSVLQREGSRFQVLAVSGAAQLSKRSTVVTALRKLVAKLRKAKAEVAWSKQPDEPSPTDNRVEPATGNQEQSTLTPGMLKAVEEYANHNEVVEFIVRPLDVAPDNKQQRRLEQATALLVVERFLGTEEPLPQPAIEQVVKQSATAIENARKWQSRGLRGLIAGLLRPSRIVRFLLVCLFIGGIAAAFIQVESDFRIAAEGRVYPRQRQFIFAPASGIVVDVMVENEADVTADQELARIESRDIEMERKRVLGEKQTIESRLAAIAATRIQNRFAPREDRNKSYADLSVEETELNKKKETLETMLRALDKHAAALTLQSNMRGKVFRWNLEQTLKDRFVQQGDRLFEVANVDEDWIIELRIRDQDVGHIQKAIQEREDPLPITFILGTTPDETYETSFDDLALSSEIDEQGELTVRATAPVPAGSLSATRPGASVYAQIDCGKRPLGYVWFRELIEFTQRRVLFDWGWI